MQYAELGDIFHAPDIFVGYGRRCGARKSLTRTLFFFVDSRSSLCLLTSWLDSAIEHAHWRESTALPQTYVVLTMMMSSWLARARERADSRETERIDLAGEEVTRPHRSRSQSSSSSP